jgi:hypothetical protein
VRKAPLKFYLAQNVGQEIICQLTECLLDALTAGTLLNSRVLDTETFLLLESKEQPNLPAEMILQATGTPKELSAPFNNYYYKDY